MQWGLEELNDNPVFSDSGSVSGKLGYFQHRQLLITLVSTQSASYLSEFLDWKPSKKAVYRISSILQ